MDKTIYIQGKKVLYRVLGKGPVVFLVHGFGEDGTVWKNQYQQIKGFRMVIPDLPGTGESEMCDNMSMEGLAQVLFQLAEHEVSPNEKIFLLGHSMGGYISLAFAEKYPDKLAGLGLVHSSAFADTEEKKATRKKGIEFIKTHGPKEFLKTLVPTLYGPVTKAEKPALIEAHIRVSHNFSGAALVSYYVSMIERPDRTQILRSAKIPVLIIMGRYDQAVPLKDGLSQAHMADLSYIQVLEKSGHMGMIEEAALTNDYITNFLNGNQKTAHPE
jgi:pimeloyl-ACP methyl ester carboxylesterase